MDNEKMQINLAPGMSKAEVIIREGAAPKELDSKDPCKYDLALFGIGESQKHVKR